MKTILSYSHVQKLIWCVVIPLIIIIILFSLCIYIYKKKNYSKRPNETNYWINYWESIISAILGATLLSISIGFCAAMLLAMKNYQLIETEKMYYYFFLIFPIIPFLFLLHSIKKFFNNLKQRYIVDEERRSMEDEQREN